MSSPTTYFWRGRVNVKMHLLKNNIMEKISIWLSNVSTEIALLDGYLTFQITGLKSTIEGQIQMLDYNVANIIQNTQFAFLHELNETDKIFRNFLLMKNIANARITWAEDREMFEKSVKNELDAIRHHLLNMSMNLMRSLLNNVEQYSNALTTKISNLHKTSVANVSKIKSETEDEIDKFLSECKVFLPTFDEDAALESTNILSCFNEKQIQEQSVIYSKIINIYEEISTQNKIVVNHAIYKAHQYIKLATKELNHFEMQVHRKVNRFQAVIGQKLDDSLQPLPDSTEDLNIVEPPID
ncbi:hypothetical protein C0J52_08509 [Blattella germanica]|nr:hypothetical protein C0J52_08509 [Blattella germanica]